MMPLRPMSLPARLSAGLAACALVAGGPAGARTAAMPRPAAPKPEKLAATPEKLAASLRLPYDSFTLPNGLRVVVHTDRSAPLVAITLAYDVGSVDEPAGRTGLAHLFEHLMFSGSENVTGDVTQAMEAIGATNVNAMTTFDYTAYFETVPVGALERALFIESDRMGHLLGAVGQDRLDAQRGVVQNEKREGENKPYGQADAHTIAGLYPQDHPLGHAPIGSMADLDAATLAQVHQWFHDHYGPNNAVLVLAGDVDVATAKRLVSRTFGAIPRGPAPRRTMPAVPRLPASRTETITDAVSQAQLTRSWPVPGNAAPDAAALTAAAALLGGSESGLLACTLVDRDQLAVSASAAYTANAEGGIFSITVAPREGVTPGQVAARLDTLLATFLKTPPDAAALRRAQIGAGTAMLQTLDDLKLRAMMLAEGAVQHGDAGFHLADVARYAALTPAAVLAASRRWLSRPSFTLVVEPGARPAAVEAATPAAVPPPAAGATADRTPPTRTPPPVLPSPALAFPKIERVTLASGATLLYARRAASPVTRVAISFDAGYGADPVGRVGTGAMALTMMTLRTAHHDAAAFAIAKEQLGAAIDINSNEDRANVQLDTPSANLAPSLGLLAETVRDPALGSAGDIATARDRVQSVIAQQAASADAVAIRTLAPLLYGPDHPYARVEGLGTQAELAAIDRADLARYWREWIRPDKAVFVVLSDRPLDEVRAAIDGAFAGWHGEGPPGRTRLPPLAPASPRIVLIDRPQAPQAEILVGTPNDLTGSDPIEAAEIGNRGLGDGFNARMNMVLREDKHWTYGANGGFLLARDAGPYVAETAVQTDKTGAALAELRRLMADYVGARPMTEAEFTSARRASIASLLSRFASADGVFGGMQRLVRLGRPVDYYVGLAKRFAGVTLAAAREAMRRTLHPQRELVVIVGDAGAIRPQLTDAGLPLTVVAAPPDATH